MHLEHILSLPSKTWYSDGRDKRTVEHTMTNFFEPK